MSYWFRYDSLNGEIAEVQVSSVEEWTNIPTGYSMVGPISESDTTAQSAAQMPSQYTVQNGQLVHSNPPTAAEQLAAAQAAQIAVLATSRDATIASGFTSSADGTSREYKSDSSSQNLMSELEESISLGVEVYPQPWIAADGTQVSLSDVSAAKQLLTDFYNVKQASWKKYMQIKQQVMNATTVSEVQAVTW